MRSRPAVPEEVERWRAETARLFLVSPARARRAAERTAREAARLPAGPEREAGRALALEARGVAEHAAGRFGRAAAAYGRAAARYDRLGLVRQAARVRKNRVDPLQYVHRISEALVEGRRAGRAFRRLGDRAGLARTLMNLAILEQRRDRPAESLHLYAQARAHFTHLGDAANLALCSLNESVARTSIDDYPRALELLDAARTQYRGAGLEIPEAEVDFDESWVRLLLGDFRSALRLMSRAREVFVRMHDPVRAAVLDLDRVDTLLLLNRPADAAVAIEGALTVFRKEKMLSEAGRALTLAGEADLALGRTARASRALGLAVRRLTAGNRGGAARARLAMARLELSRGHPRKAASLASRAARWFVSARLESSEAAARVLHAEALIELGRLAEARTLLDGLVRRSARLPAERAARSLHLRGRVLERLGRRAAAYRSLLRSIDTIERVRRTVPGALIRAAWLGDKVGVYEDAVALSLDEGSSQGDHRAFFHAEQGRARALADRLLDEGGAPPLGGGTPLEERYWRLREEARWLSGRLSREREGSRPLARDASRVAAALRRRQAGMASLLPRIQAAQEREGAVPLSEGATAAAVMGELDLDQTLIEYFVRENELVAFVLSRGGLRIVRCPAGRADLQSALSDLRHEWDRLLLSEAHVARHEAAMAAGARRALARIHDLVLAPLVVHDLARRLVIVPSGPLFDLPFAALQDARGRPLVESHEVSMAPSAAAWRSLRRRNRRRKEGGPRAASSARSLVLAVGQDLPHAAAECKEVARSLARALLFEGDAATLHVFRRHAPAAPVIHIAAHGTFRADDPLLSSIHLADAPIDQHELHDLTLTAHLVVLSGCQTALAALVAGEEVQGLAHGFLQSGAGAVLASLWSVQDASTAPFMARFHARVAKGVSPASALRDTMLAHRREHPHPYFWAPFQLLGGV